MRDVERKFVEIEGKSLLEFLLLQRTSDELLVEVYYRDFLPILLPKTLYNSGLGVKRAKSAN